MASHRSTNSTNVRFFRAALGAADAVAPNLAVQLALRTFLVPRRAERPEVERARLASAEPMMIVAAGTALRAWSWGSGPTVLLVHGWGGRGGQLAGLVPLLTAAGRRVVTFDAPAHGDSPGRRTHLVAMAEAIRGVAARLGGVDAIVAHSFGAAATTVALARGLQVNRVAYLAPLFAVGKSVERFLALVDLSPPARAAFLAELAAVNLAGPDELDGPALAPRLTAPLLVVHDRDDREVPYDDGVAAAATWAGARLVSTTGLGHRRVLDDPEVTAIVAGFVTGAPALSVVMDEQTRMDRDLANREARRERAFPG